MKGIITLHSRNQKSRAGILYLKLSFCITAAIISPSPLFAIAPVVEGAANQSDEITQYVFFTDLRLELQSNQLILISRVKKAANKVCDKIYRGQAPIMIFKSGCRHNVYRNAKPQIDMAIANAGSQAQVAINLTAKRAN